MKSFSRALISLFVFSLTACAGPEIQGIRNFHQVDDHVYRGGQPTADAFKYLAKIGVKTVLDLREADARSSAEKHLVTSLGMHYMNVPMTGLTPPTDAQMTGILSLLEDITTGAVFVHCRRGADRTGAVIAAYRIDHNHWSNARALKEALSDGMSFFQLPRQSYILKFQARTPAANSDSETAKLPTTLAPAAAAPAATIQ